jgi:hypothetical protein
MHLTLLDYGLDCAVSAPATENEAIGATVCIPPHGDVAEAARNPRGLNVQRSGVLCGGPGFAARFAALDRLFWRLCGNGKSR